MMHQDNIKTLEQCVEKKLIVYMIGHLVTISLIC